MNKKGALQMSFAWIFAILAGVFILALAIFAVTKFTGIEGTASDVKTSRGIEILLNPLEIGFESGKTTAFSLPSESKIYASCREYGDFGSQRINVSQKVYGKWSETDIEVSFVNKYIFSREPVQGKTFYLFAKPFNFPFKVSDLIYMISSEDNYCFIDAPRDIKKEISDWGLKNLRYTDCSEDSINVCFRGGENCAVDVSYDYNSNDGVISKNDENFYFSDDSLMYAGIFADADLYECQVSRLMKRTEKLSLLYEDKINFLQKEIGCDAGIKSNLAIFRNLFGNFIDSFDLKVLGNFADNIENENDFGECKLW